MTFSARLHMRTACTSAEADKSLLSAHHENMPI